VLSSESISISEFLGSTNFEISSIIGLHWFFLSYLHNHHYHKLNNIRGRFISYFAVLFVISASNPVSFLWEILRFARKYKFIG